MLGSPKDKEAWRERLRALKAERNISMQDIADKTGISFDRVRGVFEGTTKNPQEDVMRTISEYLGDPTPQGYTLPDEEYLQAAIALALQHAESMPAKEKSPKFISSLTTLIYASIAENGGVPKGGFTKTIMQAFEITAKTK